MRNLKKILALVLALVMSLSLMATASAADFKDASDITENYQTAVNVLEGLKVFKGYEDGSFNPKGEITRAEVATIIYRIATGDAEDKQASIYTDMTTSFTDLNKAEWAKGFVNYCHNAQIIKGESKTKFNPNGKITGYATLAMILRAMGYGKNGEFEGTEWEYHTAAKAKEIGLIDNVIEAQLGSNAPRELVAEILFRALLTEMVDYTVLNGYQPNGKTLGYEQFKLESVTGVVMANEWANLNDETKDGGDKVLAAGKTEMLLADNTTYELGISSDLDVVGQTCTAYMADQDNDGVREVLTELKPDAINVVDYNEGAAKTVSGLATSKLTNDTQWYKNYSESWFEEATSDYLIRYAVAKADVDKVPAWEEFINVTVKSTVSERKITATVLDANGKKVERDVDCYVRMIQPGKEITEIDQAIMQSIFYTADRLAVSNVYTEVQDYVYGEVYVGTASTKDVSDTMSWVGFKAEYFTVDVNTKKFASVGNGDSLRIIDNNGDGNAEYVLWIEYTQAKAIDTINDSLLLSSGLRMSNYKDNNLDSHDELALNDIANYYVIDKKLSIWKADIVTDTIKTKNFKDVTVTLSDGTEKGQSAIVNATTLSDSIMQMSDKPEYNMYLDEYGYIRTYELAQGKKYALLTEMYSAAGNNYNYIQNIRWIAEMKAGDTDKIERVVTNTDGSVFATPSYAWTSRALTINGSTTNSNNLNYLQPATAHLGLANNVAGTANSLNPLYQDKIWSRNVFQVGKDEMFDYGGVTYGTNYVKLANAPTGTSNTAAQHSFSFTNVAAYTLEDEAVYLETAAKLHTNTSGAQMYRSRVDKVAAKDLGTVMTRAEWEAAYQATDRTITATAAAAWFDAEIANRDIYAVYATDYVQLANQSYAAGTRHYNISSGNNGYGAKYNTLSNDYVDATVNTEYYIVSPNDVRYVVGYDNLYTIDASTVRAAYAVAQNTAKDQNGRDYWVADVIVIEVNSFNSDYDNIGLMYYNPWETSGQVRNISELNNQWRALQPDFAGKAMMDVVPARVTIGGGYVNWGNTTWTSNSYGFYRQYNTDPKSDTNGNMTAGDVRKITNSDGYNKFGIYAGTVKRITEIYSTSNYIDIDLGNGQIKAVTVNGSSYKTPVYRVNGTSAGEIQLLNDPSLDKAGVQIGDPVIVVYDNTKGGQAAYIVDVLAGQDLNKDGTVDWTVPGWLSSLYTDIRTSQAPIDSNTVKFQNVKFKSPTLPAWASSSDKWSENIADGTFSVSIDNSIATAVNMEFTTNAATTGDVVIYRDGTLLADGTDYDFTAGKVVIPKTADAATGYDYQAGNKLAHTVHYTIILTKSGVTRTVYFDVNVLAASYDASVNRIKVKGIDATRVATDTGDGMPGGSPIKWEVKLPAAAASGSAAQMVLSLGHEYGAAVTVDANSTGMSDTANYWQSTPTAGAYFNTGALTSGTVTFKVTAEDGTTERFYSLAITVEAQTAPVTFSNTKWDDNSNKSWPVTPTSTLTVPAGAVVTDSNWADYLKINKADGQSCSVTVDNNTKTIKVTVSESGKGNRVQTLTWANEVLSFNLAGEKTVSQFEGKPATGALTLQTGTGTMNLATEKPLTATITSDANAGTPLLKEARTAAVTYGYVLKNATTGVTLADPATNLTVANDTNLLVVTVSAPSIASVLAPATITLTIGLDTVA